MPFQCMKVCTGNMAHAFRLLTPFCIGKDEMYFLMGGEVPDYFNKRPEHRSEFTRPVVSIRGESKMGRPVGFPFGRQPNGLYRCWRKLSLHGGTLCLIHPENGVGALHRHPLGGL